MSRKYIPDSELSMTRKADRREIGDRILSLVGELNVEYHAPESPAGRPGGGRLEATLYFNYLQNEGDMCVKIKDKVTTLTASVLLSSARRGSSAERNTLLVSWYFTPCVLPWLTLSPAFNPHVNMFHRRKASDFAQGFASLSTLLKCRLLCVLDYSAFDAAAVERLKLTPSYKDYAGGAQ